VSPSRPALSLRLEVFLLVLLNLVLVAAVFTVFVRIQLRREFSSFLMDQARERIESLARLLAQDLHDTDPAERETLLDGYASRYGVQLVLVRNDGQVIAGRAPSIPESVLARVRPRRPPPEERGGPGGPRPEGPGPHPGAPPLPGTPPFLVVEGGPVPYWIGVRMPVGAPGPEPAVPATLLIASRTFWTNPFFFPLRPWLAAAAIVVVVSVLCWAPFVAGVTRSVRRLTHATEEIAKGRFGVQLEDSRRDELGRLGASIRIMAARLEALVTGQKRFLGDAAHELRSPLARIQVVLALLERRGDEDDRENLADLREDVEVMTRLTDELLAFARAELRGAPAALVPTPLAEVAERVVRLEARDGADVRLEVPADLAAQADPESLFRALANVVRNAVRHAGAAGPIVVRARAHGRDVALTVADSGPGLPPAALERVFEPFYRVEASRSRDTGGTGLGLAIARSCVAACGGSIECRNRSPESGLLVTIRLRAA
jgi:two-component system sensor histidine kinase CpxA